MRSVVDALSAPLEIRHYDPYGNPFGGVGSAQTDFGFTGEVTDANEQLYLRARYYAPPTGTFTALDPWEGTPQRPMSLNGYSWVEGNTPNATDPSGKCPENPASWDFAGRHCRTLAENLAAQTGQPVQNFIWMSYPQLLALSGLSTTATVANTVREGLDRAAIIPRLMEENPQVALQAIQIFSCQNQGTAMGILGVGLLGMVQISNSSAMLRNSPSRGGNIGQVVGLGILLGFGAASVWDDLSRSSISIPWGSTPMYQPQYFNADDDTSDRDEAVPIPQPNNQRMCEPSGSLKSCNQLPLGFSYFSFEDALNSVRNLLQSEKGDLGYTIFERKNEREITDNYCIGIGSHSQFYDGNSNYIGSITCCACCDGWVYGVRCFYNPSSR